MRLNKLEKRALATIRRRPLCRQTELTKALGATQQSVSRIVTSLTNKRLVDVQSPTSLGRPGKPSPRLSLVPEAAHTLGISIMADSVATGLIDFSGSLLGQELSPLPKMDPEVVLDCIEVHAGRILAARHMSVKELAGAGVAMSGYFMDQSRTFNPPTPLRDWMGLDVGQLVSDRLGIPAWADNDGNAAAMGEAALGVGRRIHNFAYLYFSTGFGGGVIVDGKLLEGRFGNSGEFAGILPYSIYSHPNLEILRHCLAQRGVSISSIHELVSTFDPEWPGIDDWIAKVKDSVSLVASACSAILDTEAIVLGGLMPRALAEKLIPHIEFYSQPRWGAPRPVPKILPAEAPGEATLFGAASMPLEHLYF